MEAKQYKESLDIALTPAMQLSYYERQTLRYLRMIDPSPAQLPPRPPDYYIKADSAECRDLMFSIFNAAKRAYGHG